MNSQSEKSLFSMQNIMGSEFAIRAVAVVVVAVAGYALYNNNKDDLKVENVTVPSWYTTNTNLMAVIWVVFYIAFAYLWTVCTTMMDARCASICNILFAIALVMLLVWMFALYGTENSLAKRLNESKWFILIAGLALLGAGLYSYQYHRNASIATIVLAAWVLYNTAGVFNLKVTAAGANL